MATKKAKATAKAAPMAYPAVAVLPPVSNTEGVQSIYVNNMQMLSMNAIDVRIAFNEVMAEEGPNGKPALTRVRRADIVMSAQHFLSMLQIMNLNAQALVAGQQQEAALMQKQMVEAIQRAQQAAAQQPK